MRPANWKMSSKKPSTDVDRTCSTTLQRGGFVPGRETYGPGFTVNTIFRLPGRVQSVYASEISILVGLETEFITELDLSNLQNLLEEAGSRVEYLVGSIHHVNEIPIDFDYPTYQRALASFAKSRTEDRQEAFLLAYLLDSSNSSSASNLRSLVILTSAGFIHHSLRLRDYPRVFEKVERNIHFAVEYGELFKVNAAAFRKQWVTAYPAKDVVEVILEHGGHFALSDDSHGPHAVGLNYHRLPEYLQSVGISELSGLDTLKKTELPNSAGRFNRPVKLDGEWLDHVFWRQRST